MAQEMSVRCVWLEFVSLSIWPKSVFFVLVGGNFDRRWNLLAENRLFSAKKLCWLNSWTTAEKIVLAQQLDNSWTTAAHSLNSWKVSGT